MPEKRETIARRRIAELTSSVTQTHFMLGYLLAGLDVDQIEELVQATLEFNEGLERLERSDNERLQQLRIERFG